MDSDAPRTGGPDGAPQGAAAAASFCPLCGAAVEIRQCKQVCPRCRSIVSNCNGD